MPWLYIHWCQTVLEMLELIFEYLYHLSVQKVFKGHAGLVKEFHVDKVGSITSQNCTDFLPFYQKSKQKSGLSL